MPEPVQNNFSPQWEAAPIKTVLSSTNNGTAGNIDVPAGGEIAVAPPTRSQIGRAPWVRLRLFYTIPNAQAAADQLGARVCYEADMVAAAGVLPIRQKGLGDGSPASLQDFYELVVDKVRVDYDSDGNPNTNWQVFIGQIPGGGGAAVTVRGYWEYPTLDFT